MDTRWARTWKPDDSMASGRRAKARLITKGFTDRHRIIFSDTQQGGFYDRPAVRMQPWPQVAIRRFDASFQHW